MKINLPRICTGREIIEAFINSSKFVESKYYKWKSEKYYDKAEYEYPGEKVFRIGVKSTLYYLYKGGKFLWFSWEPKWKKAANSECHAVEIILSTIKINNSYKFINISIFGIFKDYYIPINNYQNIEFKRICNEEMQKLIQKFYEILK